MSNLDLPKIYEIVILGLLAWNMRQTFNLTMIVTRLDEKIGNIDKKD